MSVFTSIDSHHFYLYKKKSHNAWAEADKIKVLELKLDENRVMVNHLSITKVGGNKCIIQQNSLPLPNLSLPMHAWKKEIVICFFQWPWLLTIIIKPISTMNCIAMYQKSFTWLSSVMFTHTVIILTCISHADAAFVYLVQWTLESQMTRDRATFPSQVLSERRIWLFHAGRERYGHLSRIS